MLVTESFAVEVKESSQQSHTAAEQSPLMAGLLKGEFTTEQYTWLVKQLQAVYRAIDENCAKNATRPDVSAFFDSRLKGYEAITKDWESLGAPDSVTVTDATLEFVDRLNELGENWPIGLVAHHYTRYLGDLAGGRVIAKTLSRDLGLTPENGLAFYEFPEIESIPAFRNEYRANLDSVSWTSEERARFIDEVNNSFRLNQEVFKSLEFLLP